MSEAKSRTLFAGLTADWQIVSRSRQKARPSRATRDQEAALKELDLWTGQYIKIARVALRDKKELLEKLGVRSLSGKTAAQRGATSKAATTREANKATGEKERYK